jgi:hypothetical protein
MMGGKGTRALELILHYFPSSNSLDPEIHSIRGTMIMSTYAESDPRISKSFSREP